MRSIGVDLHSNSMTVCYLTTKGQETLSTYALSDLSEFQKSLRRSDRVAVEATGNTRCSLSKSRGLSAKWSW